MSLVHAVISSGISNMASIDYIPLTIYYIYTAYECLLQQQQRPQWLIYKRSIRCVECTIDFVRWTKAHERKSQIKSAERVSTMWEVSCAFFLFTEKIEEET